jgi:hypothetical protein
MMEVSLSAINSLILNGFSVSLGSLSQPPESSRLFAMTAARTQLETANSGAELAMCSRYSLRGYLALGIGALHSTTSS